MISSLEMILCLLPLLDGKDNIFISVSFTLSHLAGLVRATQIRHWQRFAFSECFLSLKYSFCLLLTFLLCTLPLPCYTITHAQRYITKSVYIKCVYCLYGDMIRMKGILFWSLQNLDWYQRTLWPYISLGQPHCDGFTIRALVVPRAQQIQWHYWEIR